MDLGLSGRACVVTGASRGIGRATARMLCAEGADVLLVARSEERLVEAADECAAAAEAGGGRAESLAIDVTQSDAADRIVREADERFGQLDVLVNNAGAARRRDLDEVPDEDWYAARELNVMAPTADAGSSSQMGDRGWGRSSTSSSSGKRPSAATPEYPRESRRAPLSRLFADRYAAQGVLINAICPGASSEL